MAGLTTARDVRRLKAAGIERSCPVNHGPTTSPTTTPDRNRIELQIDNFDDLDKCAELMKGLGGLNPIGLLVDPTSSQSNSQGATQEELVQKTAEQIGPLDPKLSR